MLVGILFICRFVYCWLWVGSRGIRESKVDVFSFLGIRVGGYVVLSSSSLIDVRMCFVFICSSGNEGRELRI